MSETSISSMGKRLLVAALSSRSPAMVKAFAASLGELTVHLLGEGEVVLRGPARRGVVDDRLPDPGAFADFGRGVDARLELPACLLYTSRCV